MLPVWRQSFYIIHRTPLGTETTLDAGLGIDPEFLVGNEVLVVIPAKNISKGKGNGSLDQLLDTCRLVFH